MKKTAKQNRLQARMMIRLAKDGDAEGLEELLSELLEDPAAEATEAAAAANAAQALQTAGQTIQPATQTLQPAASTFQPAASEEAPVVVETPVEQPVVIDCGAEILAALKEIIGLLAGRAGDCDPEHRTEDESEAAETAEAAAEAAAGMAEAAGEAAAEIAEIAEGAGAGDPVDALVAEIMEETPETAGETAAEAAAEIISQVLEPESDPADPAETAAENKRTADALRTVLAAFRPQMNRMKPQERQAFVADMKGRLKGLSAGSSGTYAALTRSASRDASGRDLGKRIMKNRNANLRSRPNL